LGLVWRKGTGDDYEWHDDGYEGMSEAIVRSRLEWEDYLAHSLTLHSLQVFLCHMEREAEVRKKDLQTMHTQSYARRYPPTPNRLRTIASLIPSYPSSCHS